MTILPVCRTGAWRAALVAVPVIAPRPVMACAACFGKSDSPMAQGMNMGIFTLLVVVLAVLVGIAAFFFYLMRRAARFEAAAAQAQATGSPALATSRERAMPQPSQTI